MVIHNIWKQWKISETDYKYVPVCYLLPTNYKLIFWTSSRWPPFTSMHCCKRVWKLPYTRLRRSSTIAATSSTMACLSSWVVTIRLRNTRSFRNPHRKKFWYSEVGRPSRPSDVAETTNIGNTLLHVPTLYCYWPYEMASSPLPFTFTPTMTSYRAGAIFKFEMGQSAPRHPVHSFTIIFYKKNTTPTRALDFCPSFGYLLLVIVSTLRVTARFWSAVTQNLLIVLPYHP